MQKSNVAVLGPRALAAPVAAALSLLTACVDLTPPWAKGNSGIGASGGADGLALDGPVAAGGGGEGGGGGAVDLVISASGGAIGGAGGAFDAPAMGSSGGIDAGLGGGGRPGFGGSIVDAPMFDTGGAPGSSEGGLDAPLGGYGGGPGTGGTSRTDGAPGRGDATGTGGASGTGGTAGGTTGTGGASGTGGTTAAGGTTSAGGASGTGGTTAAGGTTSAGGASGTGGATAAGGTTAPDAGMDAQPDTSTLASGLLAYYPCESASGTTLPDLSGNGNNATLSANGSYRFDSGGRVGNALTLIKANSGYVSMPPAMFRGLTQITIAAWIKVVTATNWQRLFDIGINAGLSSDPLDTSTISYMNFVPQDYTGAAAVFGITNSGTANEQRISTSSALAAGTWRHVAIVLSGSAGTLYIDGGSPIVRTSVTLRPADLGTIDYAFIGRSQFGVDPYLDGMIDEFRVYNRVLSATEIQELYNFTGP